MPDARDIALFLHVLGVLVLASGIAIAAAGHARARRSGDVREIVALLRLGRAGVLLAAPGALVVVAAGTWLAVDERLGWQTGWLRAAIALFALSLALGAAGGRRLRHARELAERLRADDAEPNGELRRLLDDRTSRIANLASAAAMVAVLWLMVAKP